MTAIRVFLFIVSIFLLSVSFSAQANETFIKDQVRIHAESGEELLFDVEVALSKDQQEQGLMFRTSLPEQTGMLFVFKNVRKRSFWMKNTYIPLDIVFLDENGEIVGIHLNAKPESEESIESPAPAQYVIELDAGQASALALRVGDQFFL